MKIEHTILNKDRDVSLVAYLQTVGGEFEGISKRPGIIILPGGGYEFCSEREADPVAMCYLKAGYQVFILRYSVKGHSAWPNPLDDFEQAMECIRENTDKWNVFPDKIAVIGFSAGGHLAACAATMAKAKPNAAILGYALVGDDIKGFAPAAPCAYEAVDQNTCPCFIFSSRSDGIVPVSNSLAFMQALEKHGVVFESHIYAYGPHGFSTCECSVVPQDGLCARMANWVDDSIGWLKDVLGTLSPGGMSEPNCIQSINANNSAYLSIDCTIKHLMGNPQAGEIVEKLKSKVKKPTSGSAGNNAAVPMLDLTLREALIYANVPSEVWTQIDEALQKIPNS